MYSISARARAAAVHRPIRLLAPAVALALACTVLLAPPASAASVDSLLDDLVVATESGASTYDRDAFRHWVDADGDGCDTRSEVLIEESSVATSRTGTCTIAAGRWVSDHDGVVFTDPSGMDIDHMVPLKEAWISGAASWSAGEREAFANDLTYFGSLVAVSASSNRSKSDQDPDSWLPGVDRCEYVKRWVAVKWRWDLRLDSAEKSAIEGALSGCSSREVTTPPKA